MQGAYNVVAMAVVPYKKALHFMHEDLENRIVTLYFDTCKVP